MYLLFDAHTLSVLRLIEAANKAEQVFGPVLANRTKAEKIRSTLSVLEKFKFFFSLPSTLMDSLKHVR